MAPRYGDHRPQRYGPVDLADQIANSVYEDPEPRIWIAPIEVDDPHGPWSASCQRDDQSEDFHGSRDAVIAWARRTPATHRYVWAGGEYAALALDAADAPPPPPAGPTVQVQGPDHDGRWVALWFHRGELTQFWGTREEATAWANSQPAERRRISADGSPWSPMHAAPE